MPGMKHGYDRMSNERCSRCGRPMWHKDHVDYWNDLMQMTPKQLSQLRRNEAAFRWAEPFSNGFALD